MVKELVERLIEEALKVVAGANASVCSLGDEWSINVNGKLFHFVVVGDEVIETQPPLRD